VGVAAAVGTLLEMLVMSHLIMRVSLTKNPRVCMTSCIAEEGEVGEEKVTPQLFWTAWKVCDCAPSLRLNFSSVWLTTVREN